MPPSSRTALVAGSVVLLHLGVLWALQNGLLRRTVELIVPVQVLSAELTPPRAEAQPTPPTPTPPQPLPKPVTPPPLVLRKPAPPPAPLPAAPVPAAIADRTPAPSAATGTPDPQPTPPSVSTPVAPAAPAAPMASAKVEMPITDADYLDNPKPEWPRLSQRLGEKGRVVLRVLIGTDGRAKAVQVKESSGYTRLDNASVAAVQAARYVPGKRGGVPEEMWVNIPFWWGDKDNDGEKKP